MPTDLHQHLLPEPLIGALARRSAAPRVVGRRSHAAPRAGRRAAQRAARTSTTIPSRARPRPSATGIDRVVVSLSTALGIEALPADEAEPLVDAFNDGILELGGAVRAVGRRRARRRRGPTTSTRCSTRARAGSRSPPRALAARRARRGAPLLDRLEARGAPLFVHPGPAVGGAARPRRRGGRR